MHSRTRLKESKRHLNVKRQNNRGRQTKLNQIGKLPVELLSYVFRHSVDDEMSPWVLAKVCTRWMRIAIVTPHLWRYICITPGGDPKRVSWVIAGKMHFSRGNLQLCCNMAQLRAALQRSGVVPLEIHVECSSINASADHKAAIVRRISLIFSVLISSSISERIEGLHLKPWTGQNWTPPPIHTLEPSLASPVYTFHAIFHAHSHHGSVYFLHPSILRRPDYK